MRGIGRPWRGQQSHAGKSFWRLDKEMVVEVAESGSPEDTFGTTNNLY